MRQAIQKMMRRTSGRVYALARGWLLALLALSLPGALLICIIHCSHSGHEHHQSHHHPRDGVALFVCNHTPAGAAEQPVSAAVILQTLLQALIVTSALVLPGLFLAHLAWLMLAVAGKRLADGPPVPPPRLLLVR
jgi:hypothetical protein